MTKIKTIISCSVCIFAVAFLSACGNKSSSNTSSAKQQAEETKVEGRVSFDKITLEQADEQGRPLWTVKAQQATYSDDKKKAQIQNPSGNLYQDGQVVLQVSAAQGEIAEDGKKVFLKGKIVATDPRNQAVIRGEELEWRPQEDLLIVRNNVTGNHPQMQASAKEARYFSRKQQMELQGQIVATAKDPVTQLKTEQLTWYVPQEKIVASTPMQIDRYQGTTVTERMVGSQGEVNLKTKIATAQQNVQISSVDPPIQVTTNSATWNLNNQTVVSDRPITIVHRQEQVTVTANQAQVDLQQNVALLTGNTRGVSNRNKAQLTANQLRWEIPSQQIKAEGNVVYKQPNPPMTLTGLVGTGRLQDQTFVVTGGSSNQVVTEIVPFPNGQSGF